MISIPEVKKLLEDPALSDEEARRIRDACYDFAELALDFWKSQRRFVIKNADDN